MNAPQSTEEQLRTAFSQALEFFHRWRAREAELIEVNTGTDRRLFAECGWQATVWRTQFDLPESVPPLVIRCEYTPIQEGDESNLQTDCGEEWHLPDGLELYPFCAFCGRPTRLTALENVDGK